MIKNTLTFRVFLISFLLIALPLLIGSILLLRMSYRKAIEQEKMELELTAQHNTASLLYIKPFSRSFVGELNYALSNEKEITSETLIEMQKVIKDKVPENISISVLEPTDKNQLKVIASTHEYLHNRTIIFDKQLEKNAFSEFFHIIYNEGLFYLYNTEVSPLKNDGKYLLVSAESNEQVKDIIERSQAVHPEFGYGIVQKDGIIVLAQDRHLEGNYFFPLSEAQKNEFSEKIKRNGTFPLPSEPLPIKPLENSSFFSWQLDQKEMLGYLTPTLETGLSFFVYTEKDKIYRPITKRFSHLFLAFGVMIILAWGVFYWLTRYFARPFRNFYDVMEKVRSGDFSARYKSEKFGFEINQLGISFNQTLDKVREQITQSENYRKLSQINQKELEVGYQAQKDLLPYKMPVIDEVEFASAFIPSREAGGDFYEVIVNKEKNRVILLLADTKIKGLSACIFATTLKMLVHCYTEIYDSIEEILTATNRDFCKDTGESQVSMGLLIGAYHLNDKTLTYNSCGHAAPLLLKKNGEIVMLMHKGAALGITESLYFTSETIQLEKGDTLFLFSQGLNMDKTQLASCLREKMGSSPQEIIDRVVLEIQKKPIENEITLLVMKVSN